MFILDRLLVSGLAFVFDKVAAAVDAERDDAARLREALLAAQLRLELGEIDEAEHARVEADLLAKLRAVKAEAGSDVIGGGGLRVTGVDAEVHGDLD